MLTRTSVIACVALAVLAAVALAPSAGNAEAPESMSALLDGLTTAFRVSLEPDGFEAKANKKTLRKALRQLDLGSQSLLEHCEGLDSSTAWLRESMARDAAAALADFDAGHSSAAHRRVRQLTEHCFACHSRLPGPVGAMITQRLTSGVEVEGLLQREQVLFLVATRRFDEALAVAEQALGDPAAEHVRSSWLFEDYLKLAIRVNPAYGRARKALLSFLDATSPAPYLSRRVEAWIEDLAELEKRGTLPVNLAAARVLLDEGRARNEFPADQRGLVYFVAASGTLLRLLESDNLSDPERAETYYYLGVSESHISSSMWTDQAPFFLESAIRLRPHSDLAMDAFEFLREYTIIQNSGASGMFVPDDVWKHLEDLAALAEPPS